MPNRPPFAPDNVYVGYGGAIPAHLHATLRAIVKKQVYDGDPTKYRVICNVKISGNCYEMLLRWLRHKFEGTQLHSKNKSSTQICRMVDELQYDFREFCEYCALIPHCIFTFAGSAKNWNIPNFDLYVDVFTKLLESTGHIVINPHLSYG